MRRYTLFTRAMRALLFALLASGTLLGCAKANEIAPDEKLGVTVSIVPQRDFVERIGGEHVSVSIMVEAGNSPTTYEPKPEQLKALSRSAAYFSIGVPFEDVWLDRIAAANPEMMMVDTIADIERMALEADHDHAADEKSDHDDHAEGAPDPHVWLSPKRVAIQARAIYSALAALDPAHEAVFSSNLEAFLADIDALDAEIALTLAHHEGKAFMVFHPSWGYFAHDYGLEQIPVEVGGQEPSARELAQLIEIAREQNIHVILAQPEFSTEDAETIAQGIDGKVLLISPLAPNWLGNMRTVADTFADVLSD